MSEQSQPFAEMAARVAGLDRPEEFAGAVVIVPPTGEPVAFMAVDPTPVLAQFWTNVAARVELAAGEAQDAENKQGGWPRR